MREVTLTAKVTDSGGHVATASKKVKVPTLIGMNAPWGASWNSIVVDYPGMKYTRDFGKDYGSTGLTKPTTYGTDKFIALPTGAVMHMSWKDSPSLLQGWLDALPQLPVTHPGFFISPWHEPRDKVDSGVFTTAQFRAWGEQLAQIIANHPKGKYVKGNGPILTRFDLDEKNVDPRDYGYNGMTHYGVDCYSQSTTSYYTTAKMFDFPFNKILSAFPTVRLWVPEYGLVRTTADSTGTGRADTIRQHFAYLKTHTKVDAAAYFNATGSIPDVPFTVNSPEGIAFREILATQ